MHRQNDAPRERRERQPEASEAQGSDLHVVAGIARMGIHGKRQNRRTMATWTMPFGDTMSPLVRCWIAATRLTSSLVQSAGFEARLGHRFGRLLRVRVRAPGRVCGGLPRPPRPLRVEAHRVGRRRVHRKLVVGPGFVRVRLNWRFSYG